MNFTIIANPRARHQVDHQRALAAGLSQHGIDSIVATVNYANTKYVACWGWRQGKQLREAGHEVLVMERGYLGDRFAWTSLAWNGLNGRGKFAEYPNDGGERFNKYFQMKPWKTNGDYVLVMGQVPGDASLQGRNMVPWYEQAAMVAQTKYGLPVFFRPHPVALQKGHKQIPRGVAISKAPLQDMLDDAAVVITYNSNSAVDAVLAGVPAVACDRGSMAYAVAGHSIGEMLTPKRDQWAAELAWKQWRIEEIESGGALAGLLEVANGQ